MSGQACRLWLLLSSKRASFQSVFSRLRIFSAAAFKFNTANQMARHGSEFCHQWSKCSHRHNGDCVASAGPTLWKALCERLWKEKGDKKKKKPQKNAGASQDWQPPFQLLPTSLRADNASANDRVTGRNRAFSDNEPPERRWTQQTDTHSFAGQSHGQQQLLVPTRRSGKQKVSTCEQSARAWHTFVCAGPSSEDGAKRKERKKTESERRKQMGGQQHCAIRHVFQKHTQ